MENNNFVQVLLYLTWMTMLCQTEEAVNVQQASVGTNVTLTCPADQYKDHYNLTYVWRKVIDNQTHILTINSHIMDKQYRVTLLPKNGVFKLHIFNVGMENEGTYECKIGRANSTFKIHYKFHSIFLKVLPVSSSSPILKFFDILNRLSANYQHETQSVELRVSGQLPQDSYLEVQTLRNKTWKTHRLGGPPSICNEAVQVPKDAKAIVLRPCTGVFCGPHKRLNPSDFHREVVKPNNYLDFLSESDKTWHQDWGRLIALCVFFGGFGLGVLAYLFKMRQDRKRLERKPIRLRRWNYGEAMHRLVQKDRRFMGIKRQLQEEEAAAAEEESEAGPSSRVSTWNNLDVRSPPSGFVSMDTISEEELGSTGGSYEGSAQTMKAESTCHFTEVNEVKILKPKDNKLSCSTDSIVTTDTTIF